MMIFGQAMSCRMDETQDISKPLILTSVAMFESVARRSYLGKCHMMSQHTTTQYVAPTVSVEAIHMSLIKSRQRVADHGEVFTPAWLVEAMLDLVKDETERIDSRFLEPACGSGNFLVPILKRKLAAVEARYSKSEFERRHFALLALMCVYGIELLEDNVLECRSNLLEVICDFLNEDDSGDLYFSSKLVLSLNIVHGDALTMRTYGSLPITFAEWAYVGKGRYQRRDFKYSNLTQASTFSVEGSLFSHLGKHEIFIPKEVFAPMTMRDLAAAFVQRTSETL